MEIRYRHTPAWLFASHRNAEPHGSVGLLGNCVAPISNRPTEVNGTGRDQSVGWDLSPVEEIVLAPVATRKLPAVQNQVDWKPLHVRLSTFSTQNKKKKKYIL